MSTTPANDPHGLAPLLARALPGDAKALNELLAKLRPLLHQMVRRQLGPEHPRLTEASSIVQEGLLNVTHGFGPRDAGAEARFRGDNVPQFLGWVAAILRNVIQSHHRYWDAAKRRGRPVADSGLLDRVSGGSAPDDRAARAEEAAGVAEALERLPEHYRQVIELHVFERLKFPEVAERLGKSAGAVRVVYVRALRRLREEMEAGR